MTTLQKVLLFILASSFLFMNSSNILAKTSKNPKPAILFVSRPLQPHYGGGDLKKNITRLDKAGYRVAYYSYKTLNTKKPSILQRFDVIVMLDQPGVDWTGNKKLKPVNLAQFKEIRKLLKAGGGLLLFGTTSESHMQSFDKLAAPYGARILSGCLTDKAPVLSTFCYVRYAYTDDFSKHPLTDGVKGLWHPIGAKEGARTHFDTIRNANTYPFDVDKNWTVLAWGSKTTKFKVFGKEEGADTQWLLNKNRQELTKEKIPLLAIRDGVEGAGRMAICGINFVFSDFCAGNTLFDGVCTGKGLEGKKSDLDRLLMNVVNWLGEKSVRTRADKTIAQSDKKSFNIPPYKFPPRFKKPRGLMPNQDQFIGIVGPRTVYSGGKSTVKEYAEVAKKLGLQYIAFLEDYENLDDTKFEQFKKECDKYSDNSLILIPGIRLQTNLGVHYFGFRKEIALPQKSFLKPGTRKLLQMSKDRRIFGQIQWTEANGQRFGMAHGNFRLEEKLPNGIPPSDYNLHNPFISIYTYKNGKLVDSMMDTYLKCAARTEWVSPISIHLIDSVEELKKEWKSNSYKTIYLRAAGAGLNGFKNKIGDMYSPHLGPTSYVTNGPKIKEWRSSGFDCLSEWFDWTRLHWQIKMKVSSKVGLKEIRIMNGTELYRRFLPNGAKEFERTLVLTHTDMHNMILIAEDLKGCKAISDEEWDKNQLLQLTWCVDRNNMLSYSGLPAPKASSGTMAGNFPTPWNLEKGGFRENMVPAINQDRSRLPHFDGQPFWAARVSPVPSLFAKNGSEGGTLIARDIGRDLCSPDVAIQRATCKLVYDKKIVKRPLPWTRGPLVPLELFNADMTYTTFSHQGHEPTPVILEGAIKILKDITFPERRKIDISVLTLSAWRKEGGYNTAVIKHSKSGDMLSTVSYVDNNVVTGSGAFNKGAYFYIYPSLFGSVGIVSLTDNLSYKYINKHLTVGFDLSGKTLKKGTELKYKLIVLVSGFDEVASTQLPENFRKMYGLAEKGKVAYKLTDIEQGEVSGNEYTLTIDGKGKGFAGTITLSPNMPCALPIIVENLNNKWTSVLYDRDAKKMRPLGMNDNKAYCHRSLKERTGRLFIGHPFTLDNKNLNLSFVQFGDKDFLLQVSNPTDKAITTTLRKTKFFDLIKFKDRTISIPAGGFKDLIVTYAGEYHAGKSQGEWNFDNRSQLKLWSSIRRAKVNGKIKFLGQRQKPTFISFLESDGAAGSKGCLKVNIHGLDKLTSLVSWYTGAAIIFKKPIPKGRILVTFMAKSISGAKILSVTRGHGGSSQEIVSLTNEWKKYSVVVNSKIAVSYLMFTLVEPTRKVAAGEFLLDNISVKSSDADQTAK